MSRVWPFARRYGLDVLIVIAAVESALEVAFRNDVSAAPRTTPWFAVPAVAIVVLPLLARRRFPFGAPAALWLLAAAFSFVDGRLVVFALGTYAAGLFAAALLGNLRDERQARLGLALVIGATVIIVYNDPKHAAGEYIFIPAVFALGWLAGFALHERSEQAEAAELRATQAERERDAASRIAVAEERARIARELHDIVAHSVSVMVLQVGAVRHQLPEADAPQTGCAQRRRGDGPHRARRDAPPPRRHAPRRRRSRAGAAAGARQRGLAARRGSPRGPAGDAARGRRAIRRSRARSTCRRTGSSRRA